jgi:tetratricopeptide (TPR) repeat protein
MADITNVNLLYLRKARGVAPLSRYAMRDDATLVVSVPDEMEVRTFHVARFDARGRSQVLETYSVETLRRTEIAASGASYVGTTDDDLYVFQGGRKTRFLPDRRAAYTDIALSESGQRFATAFSDLLASGHTLALGDNTGRLLWTRDVAFPISRVAVDRDAQHMAVAGETGDVLLYDAARNIVLRHRQEVPIAAVATVGPARTVFAGGGGVGAIDDRGGLLWFTELVGEPVDVALSGDGTTAAVLVRLDDMTGRLYLLSGDGLPNWDVDYEDARPTGVSLSPDGRHCAVTLRDGSICVYELHYGERLGSLSGAAVLAEARAAREGEGSLRGAIELLKGRLAAVPADTAACEMLAETLADMKARTLSAAQSAEAVGDFAAADARLAEAVALAPFDPDFVAARRDLRARWSASALAAARASLDAHDGPAAEAHLLDAIEADPLDAMARALLADARFAAAENATARGRELIATGQFTDAVAALAEAQRRGATGPEVTQLLRDARVGEALALGNALYQDRQYAAAMFQFKKVLRLDPDNAEAQQKVGYAQNFLQDTQLNDRFTRLE